MAAGVIDKLRFVRACVVQIDDGGRLLLNRLQRFTLALLLALAAPCGAVLAAMPTVDELAAVLWRYNELNQTDLPIPSSEQLGTLIDGDMLDLRERTPIEDWRGKPQDRIRVVGYQLIERPRLLVWLATLNASAEHSQRLTEHLVDDDDAGTSIWYQHLNTPWPVRNRHWVIRNDKNTEIAKATSGLVWEHNWELAERGQDTALNLLLNDDVEGLDEKDADSSIYLTVNRGAWTMFAVNDEVTLVVAHTTADMGGWIPESWVARFSSRQLTHVLKNLTAKADTVHKDYTGDYTVFGGDGVPIAPSQASDVRRQFHLSQDRSASTRADESHRQ
ncbi:MAG: hypothetical protein AB8G17_03000 [Gammaproteobacteria bacterium]